MNDQSTVMVLSQTEYKESDALVKVLSKELGLVTFIAKGLSKINSKNRMGCLPYGESLFMYDLNELSNLQVLHTAQSLFPNLKIHDDLEKSSIASLVVELSELLLKNETDSLIIETYYSYLKQTFNLLSSTDQHRHLLAYILISFLNYYGIAPQVDECVICGSTQINSIATEEGGFICQNCQRELQSPLYSLEILKDFRVVGKLNSENITRYLSYQAPSSTLIRILVDFLKFHTGHPLKSWEFIEKCSIIK